MKKVMSFVAALVMLAVSTSLVGTAYAATNDNIMDIVAADDRFDTLEAAIKAANLADTVASANNTFTVFAPTDAAFAALPAGTVESLLADPQGALTNVLLYHVVAGAKGSAEVVSASTLPTVQGTNLAVSVKNGMAYVNNSMITVVDIPAKNGVIHVIDAVLVPTGTPAPSNNNTDSSGESESTPAPINYDTTANIMDIVAADDRFNTLEAAIKAANLADTIASANNTFTVFAPTDAAFAALPAGTVESLLADPQGALTQVLLYHVVSGAKWSGDVVTAASLMTLQGGDLAVSLQGGNAYVNNSMITVVDIPAKNGVIHVIDAVLVP